MRVIAAVFGEENFLWPYCKENATVATLNRVEAQRLWEARDKEGYIQDGMKQKTVRGVLATRQVASTWYGLMTTVSDTSGDVWIHKEDDRIWWTTSKADPAYYIRDVVEPVGAKRRVVVCHKPCDPWKNVGLKGQPLLWHTLHPKAKDFLTTQSTLRPLGAENAAYALALIAGDPLDWWHSQTEWKQKFDAARTKQAEVTYVVGQAKAAYKMAYEVMPEKRMADTAFKTGQFSNGQKVDRTMKNKDVLFPDRTTLSNYITALLEMQENYCALTGLRMDYAEDGGDPELYCSLDRIDSDGHYAEGNLQVVCRFANRWKGAGDDVSFKRLIDVIRNDSVVE
ncbi:hypothetical protein Rleg9DRAFT_5954 [Rhizobium leguminosarum bv. trifolii WSM597]|uniref:Uncharacterized protein n=1 Tax=Rhizobium leguminosarum bv. trifolii WSM597 TaxID=754764 RepID=J0H9B7_RHILT|nr:hypothetical protein [Rhizobium leguminosarum]EJB06985.1 hypothetical protein Rleg9DRAFT_5954 [Rhizobium leguminosarum bv. trifolii WSM597]